jgi:hypothetical protein
MKDRRIIYPYAIVPYGSVFKIYWDIFIIISKHLK